jgi:hypothetical protein
VPSLFAKQGPFLRRTLGPPSTCRLQTEVHQQQVIVRYFGLLPHQQLRVRRFCIGLLIPMRQDSENETWRAFVFLWLGRKWNFFYHQSIA